jgi:hypothetical protein
MVTVVSFERTWHQSRPARRAPLGPMLPSSTVAVLPGNPSVVYYDCTWTRMLRSLRVHVPIQRLAITGQAELHSPHLAALVGHHAVCTLLARVHRRTPGGQAGHACLQSVPLPRARLPPLCHPPPPGRKHAASTQAGRNPGCSNWVRLPSRKHAGPCRACSVRARWAEVPCSHTHVTRPFSLRRQPTGACRRMPHCHQSAECSPCCHAAGCARQSAQRGPAGQARRAARAAVAQRSAGRCCLPPAPN